MKLQQQKGSPLERLRLALLVALAALVASLAVGCAGARQAEPAGNGTTSDDAAEEPAAEAEHPDSARYIERDIATDYVPADAEFMRDMIVHHGQALEMSALVPERTDSEDMRLMARRIEETQQYEIGLMRDWLEERGLSAPDPGEMLGPHGGHGADHSGMAGMASPEQMRALAAAEGEAFDRMFLELMIRHHEGALIMVDELLAHEGAGQEPELFVLLSHVDADQRAEIARMRRLLEAMEAGSSG